jgi:carbon-monoxide dehydrogenase small subunit
MSINIPVSGQSNEIYSLSVNGQVHQVKDAWIGESLLYVLRERLGLPGSKGACEQGECGSCTVIVESKAVCSCLVMAADAVNTEILTVDGLGPNGALTDVQALSGNICRCTGYGRILEAVRTVADQRRTNS